MQGFDFIRATSIGRAVALLLGGSDSRLLADGQAPLAAMKLGLAAPARLIDLSRLPGLPGLQMVQAGPDGQCTVGAMASHATLARQPWLRQHLPGLAHLAGGIAEAQVRERGTIGGSAANADPSACWRWARCFRLTDAALPPTNFSPGCSAPRWHPTRSCAACGCRDRYAWPM